MENKIILVGKLVTEHADEIAEGFTQVEFEVEELLDEIDSCDIKKYASHSYDLIDKDDMSDVDEDDMVEELRDRGYNFIRGADDEALINELEKSGYKCIYEYDKEYYHFLDIAQLDVQDMHMLKEITKRFIDSSVFKKADIHKAVMGFGF